jgi:Lsr2
MAQRTTVTLTCDAEHGDGEVNGETTIQFSWEGVAYEIDVCRDHEQAMKETFGYYAEHARKQGRAPGSSGSKRSRSSSSRQKSSEIRDWAKSQGIEISERGRIPADVIARYEAHQSGNTVTGSQSPADTDLASTSA